VLSALKAKGDVLFAPELGINLLWDGVWGRPSSAATARRAGPSEVTKVSFGTFCGLCPRSAREIAKGVANLSTSGHVGACNPLLRPLLQLRAVGLSTKSPVLTGQNAKSHVLFAPRPGRSSKADLTPKML